MKCKIIAAILAIPIIGGILVHLAGVALATGGWWLLPVGLAATILALKRHA